MKPLVEFTRNGASLPEIFGCAECGRLHFSSIYATRHDLAVEAARRSAEECCAPRHCDCGTEISKSWTKCDRCRERDKLIRATEVDPATYSGPVYADGWGGDWGEGYFSEVGVVRERCSDFDEPLPVYVETCEQTVFRLDADNILESALDEHHEDAADQIVDGEELATFLKAWSEKQTLVSYYPVRGRVIVLDRDRFEALKSPEPAA